MNRGYEPNGNGCSAAEERSLELAASRVVLVPVAVVLFEAYGYWREERSAEDVCCVFWREACGAGVLIPFDDAI